MDILDFSLLKKRHFTPIFDLPKPQIIVEPNTCFIINGTSYFNWIELERP